MQNARRAVQTGVRKRGETRHAVRKPELFFRLQRETFFSRRKGRGEKRTMG